MKPVCLYLISLFASSSLSPSSRASGDQRSESDVGVECVPLVNARISVKVLEAVSELGFRSQRSDF